MAGEYSRLLKAFNIGNYEEVKKLIETCTCLTAPALSHFASNGCLELLEFFLERGVEYSDEILFYAATCSKSLPIVKYIREKGYDIHAENERALNNASFCGHLHIVQYLIDNGANPNSGALSHASANGHLDIVKYLIHCGAQVCFWDNRALVMASCYGHLEVVKYLVEHGADIQTVFALVNAGASGRLDVVKYLVEKGARVNADNDIALRTSSSHGELAIVKFLVKNGGDIHAMNDYALAWSSFHEHFNVVHYLIQCGADTRVIRNEKSLKLLNILNTTKRRAIITIQRRWRARIN